jgi:hypothetical protein
VRALLAAVVVVALAGCGGSAPDKDAVQKLAEKARADLVAGRAEQFCARLSAHGRARSLVFKIDFDQEATIPPDSPRLPQTCEEVVRRELAAERDPRVDPSWLPKLRDADLRVADVKSTTARIEIVPRGSDSTDATVRAVRTSAGWRLDDSNVIPVGH